MSFSFDGISNKTLQPDVALIGRALPSHAIDLNEFKHDALGPSVGHAVRVGKPKLRLLAPA